MKIIIIGAGVAVLAVAYLASQQASDGESDNSADITDYTNQALDYGSAIFEATDDMTAQANINAFLSAIRVGEGTSGGNGYSILCGGGIFGSYENHPAMNGWGGLPLSAAMCANAGFSAGCVSTAAGAYQINKPTYKNIAGKLGITDFSPDSQDRIALELIRQKGALSDVMAGRVAVAVAKVAKVWASLPSAGYGQREVSMNNFINDYTNYGGATA
jgi:muramidase (phage lysozyme)